MKRRAALISLLALLGCGKEPPAPVVGKQAGSGVVRPAAPDAAPPPEVPALVDAAAKRGAALKECERLFGNADPFARQRAMREAEACGEEALPLLRKGLMDPILFVRVEAAEVWTRVSADATEGVAVLVEEVSTPGGSVELRISAIRALGALGPRARAAISALVAALSLRSREVVEAMDALASIGEEAVPAVIETARRSTDEAVRSLALQLLGRMAPLNPDAIAAMRQALLGADPGPRAEAAEALGPAAAEQDVVVDALAPFLNDPDGHVRAAAGRALRRAGRRSLRAGQALVGALRDDLAGGPVATLLCELGPESAPLLDAIRPMLTSLDPSVAARAALALSCMGAAAAPALPDLICAWEASLKPGIESSSRASLRRAISQMGELAVVPVLDLMRGSHAREVKLGCIDLLVELSPSSADAASALSVGLRDEALFGEIVAQLELRGPLAWRSAPDLIEAERTAKSDAAREPIYRALGAIGVRDAASVKAVREMMPRAGHRADDLIESLVTAGAEGMKVLSSLLLFDPAAPDRRRLAVEVLTALPGGLDGEVTALTGLLGHADPETRRAAARAFCIVRAQPEATVKALARLLDDASPRVRRAAVLALAAGGRAAAPAAARLRACESDADPDVRCLALLTLGLCGAEPKSQVLLLDTLLNNTRPESRAAAARALSRISSLGMDVFPSLVNALKDRNGAVVTEALIALSIVGADRKVLEAEMKRREAGTTADFGAAVVNACSGRSRSQALRDLVSMVRAGLPESHEDIATSLLVQLGPEDTEVRRELLDLCTGPWPGRHAFRLALASRTK